MKHKRSKLRNDTNVDVNMVDRISELPEFIVHEILSHLPTRDAAKTMVLSKKWKHTWSSFHILDLNQIYFGENLQTLYLEQNDPRVLEISEKFINFVDNTLLRYHQQKNRIQKLNLRMTHVDFKKASLVDKWIGLAIQNLVKELNLIIISEKKNMWYNLPQTIFAGKSIVELKLYCCKLEPPISMGNTIKLYSLQKLLLCQVYVDEQTIQSLIYSCPLIDQLALLSCWGFKKFQVSKPCKLRVFEVEPRRSELERVDIEAPSLEDFIYKYHLGFMSCEINVAASQNLKFLHLEQASITDQWLHDYVPKLPLLKRLFLDRCIMLERVIFSSHSLESITLNGCKKLMEVEIVTPRLLEFQYFMNTTMPLVSLKAPQCEPRITLQFFCEDHLDACWFLTLREFLKSLVQSEILTLNISSEKNTFNVEELGDVQELGKFPPYAAYRLEELKLVIASSLLDYAALVDGLLWSCHPKTLSVRSESESNKKFLKCLSEKLMDREHQDCCISSRVKCWRHYLKDFRIENFEGDEDGRPLHGDAFPNDEIFCFRLIWQS